MKTDDAIHVLTERQDPRQTFGYFFRQGILDLCDAVERATQQALQDWNVLDKAFLHVPRAAFVMDALPQIRALVEEWQQRERYRRSLWRFFVPPDSQQNFFQPQNPNATESEVLAETWDWLESPLLQEALRDTLTVTFEYGVETCLPWDNDNEDETNTALSLAQLLPKLKKCAARFQASADNPLLRRVYQVPTVQEIGTVCFR